MPSPRRLFHAIVVLGAALAHCGGKAERSTEEDDESGGSEGDASADAGKKADASNPCVGSAERPESCASPADFFCDYCNGNGNGTAQQKCDCDAAAPDNPDACDKPQDYHCQSYEPMTGCWCVPGSPASESDCEDPSFFSCRVNEPPIGCDCITVITR